MNETERTTSKAIALLKNLHGCKIGAKEYSGGFSRERVDAILFNSSYSFVIETKISRSDFIADRKKPSRIDPSKGVGDFRYYACPEGLIDPEELPEKWGLIYVSPGNKRAQMVVGYGGNIKTGETKHPEHGWTVPTWETHGSNRSMRHKFLFNRNNKTERDFLFHLATRYKSGKFNGNIL